MTADSVVIKPMSGLNADVNERVKAHTPIVALECGAALLHRGPADTLGMQRVGDVDHAVRPGCRIHCRMPTPVLDPTVTTAQSDAHPATCTCSAPIS